MQEIKMNNELFENLDKINSMDKPEKKPEKVDECKECTTRGNCNERGQKCDDYAKDNDE